MRRMISMSRDVRSRAATGALALLVGLSLLGGAGSAAAQELGGIGSLEASGITVYARPGEATVQVLVMNGLGASGIYKIGESIRLDELLLLSGTVLGAQTEAEEREVTVRLLRGQGGQRSPIYEASLEQVLTEPSQHPELQEGDVLMVEVLVRQKGARFSWRDGLSILTATVSLTTIALRLFGS